MRLVLLTAAGVAALVTAGFAQAGETPNPAVAACIAQYQQLGTAGFAAKYGVGDAGRGACLAANGGTTTQPAKPVQPVQPAKPVQPATSDLVKAILGRLCTNESSDAGKRSCMQTKVAQAQTILVACGPSLTTGKSAFEQCVKQAMGASVKTTTRPPNDPGKNARSACETEARAIGIDAFQVKYGKGVDGVAACLRAHR
jgi:hypothetical protein